jgi:hypothetical protein
MNMKDLAKPSVAALILLWLPVLIGRAQERGKELCPLPQSIRVDVYDSLPPKAQTARLEKLIPVMEAQKDSHGFIVAYAGSLSSLAAAQRAADQAKRQLLSKHEWIGGSGVNSRVNTLVCGYRVKATMELWVTPVGAAPPVCAPTVVPEPRAKSQPRRPR